MSISQRTSEYGARTIQSQCQEMLVGLEFSLGFLVNIFFKSVCMNTWNCTIKPGLGHMPATTLLGPDDNYKLLLTANT